jgi:hypothetical protein
MPLATRLVITGRCGTPRPGAEANRTQHSSGLWRHGPAGPGGCARQRRPGRSRYSWVPDTVAIQKRLARPPRGASRSARLTGGAGRQAILLRFTGRGPAGVGRTWDGHKPSPLPWDSFALSPMRPPTHRRTAARSWATAIDEAGAAGVPSKRLVAWALPDLPCGVNAPLVSEVVVGGCP